MLSQQDNERLTRVGPGTPMGNLFRRYWIPALLSEELVEADGPPVPDDGLSIDAQATNCVLQPVAGLPDESWRFFFPPSRPS